MHKWVILIVCEISQNLLHLIFNFFFLSLSFFNFFCFKLPGYARTKYWFIFLAPNRVKNFIYFYPFKVKMWPIFSSIVAVIESQKNKRGQVHSLSYDFFYFDGFYQAIMISFYIYFTESRLISPFPHTAGTWPELQGQFIPAESEIENALMCFRHASMWMDLYPTHRANIVLPK